MIEDFLGKIYQENGRGPDGYDCYGVCIEVCKRFGVELPEQESLIRSAFERVHIPAAGNIAFIPTPIGDHVGVMVSEKDLLTVYSTGRIGVHRMSLKHRFLKGRVEGIYRYVG